ncbi:MAG: ATP-binding cassette domain-containing protein [Candidatus Eremiobacteraeota bacterium]|nr:ATP-binding cassette domain-containing protein [Candidatus Eremiobacteraeota bacterium]
MRAAPRAGGARVVIVLDGVTKRFGAVVAVDDARLSFARGALTAVLGPSGCGKSTLLRLVAGYDVPDAGRVLVDGADVTDKPLRARNVGFVFQHGALFPHLSVEENVGFALTVRGVSRAKRRARVRELLDVVQLAGYGSRRPHELSGGQRQRVALARALAPEPAILLLDEPFSALDLHVRRELRGWLRALHERTHVTTLLVTHDADEALEIADDVVVMRDGRVEQAGAPGDLYDVPVNPFVLGFLGPANALADGPRTLFVRPHEFRVAAAPFDGARRARIARIVPLGARTRYDCQLDTGGTVTIEVPVAGGPAAARVPGDALYVAPTRARTFDDTSEDGAEGAA